MNDHKPLNIHFLNGTKWVVSFPTQIKNSTAGCGTGSGATRFQYDVIVPGPQIGFAVYC